MPVQEPPAGGKAPPKPPGKVRADQALVDRGLVESRAKAQALIMAGKVFSGERKLDKAGVSEGVYRIFSKHKVSIARVIQYEHPNQGRGTVTLSTYPVDEQKMSKVLTELGRLKTVLEDPVVLRIFSPES